MQTQAGAKNKKKNLCMHTVLYFYCAYKAAREVGVFSAGSHSHLKTSTKSCGEEQRETTASKVNTTGLWSGNTKLHTTSWISEVSKEQEKKKGKRLRLEFESHIKLVRWVKYLAVPQMWLSGTTYTPSSSDLTTLRSCLMSCTSFFLSYIKQWVGVILWFESLKNVFFF